MKILALDDGELALEMIAQAIAEAAPEAEVFPFRKPSELIAFAKDNPCSIAFLDIHMWGMNGLQVAKLLKENNPQINIIFVTCHAEYASAAFKLYPSGYVLKPVTKEAVERELENLRHPVAQKKNARVFVRTFGNFEIFVNGSPLVFARSKTKELLAYLVNRRGAFCRNNEIIAVIWEDKADSSTVKSHFRHLISDLTQTLKSEGVEDILLKQRGCLAVVPENFSCDLYDFYNSDADAVNSYSGEFMAQYSWAEFTNSFLYDMY